MVIKNSNFEAEPVLMDFHEFRHCTFKKCRLVYCGYSMVTVNDCRFEECRWEFSGPAAVTLQFLASLRQSGSEMGRMIVGQALGIIHGAGQQPAPPTAPPANGLQVPAPGGPATPSDPPKS